MRVSLVGSYENRLSGSLFLATAVMALRVIPRWIAQREKKPAAQECGGGQ
jgi:hypothetical protein